MTATATKTPENNDLIDWMSRNDPAACVVRTLVEFFDVVCQMAPWNFQIQGFNDNVNTQQ